MWKTARLLNDVVSDLPLTKLLPTRVQKQLVKEVNSET